MRQTVSITTLNRIGLKIRSYNRDLTGCVDGGVHALRGPIITNSGLLGITLGSKSGEISWLTDSVHQYEIVSFNVAKFPQWVEEALRIRIPNTGPQQPH